MGYTANDIRNICLLGHGGDGKSALCESMLFTTKAITRLGKRADGTTVSDFDDEEKKRQYSISSSVIPVEYSKCKINVIDNPGYFDFAGNMDMAIAIRTAVLKEGTAYVQAGAGLVMDSNPDSETLETVNKSAAPLRAVLTASGLAPLDADAAVNATK